MDTIRSPTAHTYSESLQANDNSNPQQGSGGVKLVTMNNPETSKEGKASVSLKNSPSKKDSRKLFVGGLPADVMDDEFKEFFEKFGVVVDSVVMYDRETHRSRGFGFVTFQDPEVANKLLSMGNDGKTNGDGEKKERVGRLVMRGKPCEVKAAEPKESRAQRRPFHQGGGMGPNRYVGNDRRNYSGNKVYMSPDPSVGAEMFNRGHPYHPIGYNPDMQGVIPGAYPGVPPVSGYFQPIMGMHGNPGYMPPAFSPMTPVSPQMPANGGHNSGPNGHHALVGLPPLVGQIMEPHAGPSDVIPQMYYPPPPYMSTPHQLHPSQLHPTQLPPQSQFQAHIMGPNQGSYSRTGDMSAMHPAAPGLPGKDNNASVDESAQI